LITDGRKPDGIGSARIGPNRFRVAADHGVIAQEDNSFLLFVSPSWGQGFRIVRKFRDAGDRVFKNFDRLLSFVRGPLRYRGRVIIYSAEAADVASMAGGDIDKRRSAKSSRSHLSVVGG
jgi:hypothetical protein